MRTPLICNNLGDIDVFLSLEDAAQYLEPIDIKNNEYTFFDADGYIVDAYIAISPESTKPSRLGVFSFLRLISNDGCIRFKRRRPLEQRRDDLTQMMRDYLIRNGQNTMGGDLELLLMEVLQFLHKHEKLRR